MIKFFVLKHEKYKKEKINGMSIFRDDFVMMVDNKYFSYDYNSLRWERDPNLDQDSKNMYDKYNEVDGFSLKKAITVYTAKKLLLE